MKYTRQKIKETVKSKEYIWFDDVSGKDYDVNIIGIRNSETKDKVTNRFDDIITIS